MEQAGNQLNTYWYEPSSVQYRGRGKHLILGRLYGASCLWARLKRFDVYTRTLLSHAFCGCIQVKVRAATSAGAKENYTQYIWSRTPAGSWEDLKQMRPSTWPRLDISSLRELSLTRFKMSQRGDPRRTCEWARMKENWSTLPLPTLCRDSDRCE